ncbi:MAG: response regulator [Thermodesulfobacteriota bacterium]
MGKTVLEDKRRSAASILIVDDHRLNIDLLEGILSTNGYTIDSAMRGEEALEKIIANPPDLILLDVMMPKMDGYEVCRNLRSNKTIPYIPIIFITASELEQKSVIEGLDAGGDDYVRKPFDADELIARVSSCLRVKRVYEELAQIKKELSRYVSLSTLRMVENKIKGQKGSMNYDAYVTVLFSDIRGFTQIAEGWESKEVFDQLNATIGKQLRVIEKYEGIIDKLSGDEVMAVFEGPGMGEKALRCALEIVHELSESERHKELELPYVGIGINTGPIYLGSLGTDLFRDYTIIGNTVNIAARLCAFADRFQVLITKTTLESIQQEEFRFKSIGEKMLKGLSKPMEVFQVIS